MTLPVQRVQLFSRVAEWLPAGLLALPGGGPRAAARVPSGRAGVRGALFSRRIAEQLTLRRFQNLARLFLQSDQVLVDSLPGLPSAVVHARRPPLDLSGEPLIETVLTREFAESVDHLRKNLRLELARFDVQRGGLFGDRHQPSSLGAAQSELADPLARLSRVLFARGLGASQRLLARILRYNEGLRQ
jgi:hypothetical protein